MSEENDYKRTLIALLVELSEIDGYLNDQEVAFVMSVANQIGMSADDISAMRRRPGQVGAIPTSEQDRMSMLYYLLFLMKIDGHIQEKEVHLIRKVGFKLGFHHDMTEEMIQIIKRHVDNRLPAETLLQTVKKYLN